jgi:hypothetical protein
MTCLEVSEYLDRTSLREWDRLPEMLRTHLDGCKCCRALWDLLSRRPCPRPVPGQVRSRIHDQLLDSLEPVKPLAGPGKFVFGFMAIFAGFAVPVALIFPSPESQGVSTPAGAAIVGVSVLAALMAAATLSREMVPGDRRNLPLALTLSTGTVGLLAVVALMTPWEMNAHFWMRITRCFIGGSVLALPAFVLAVMVLRRGAVLSPGAVGASAGLLASLISVVGLHYACPTLLAPHVALGHITLPIAGALAGYAAGRLLPARWFGSPQTEGFETS